MGERRRRLRRTELTVPGHSAAMLAKAAAGGADEVICDLEDAVAFTQKEAARCEVAKALSALSWGEKVRALRVNPIEMPWFLEDVLTVIPQAGAAIDTVILPKVNSPDEVKFLCALLSQLERKHGLGVGRMGLEVLIETPSAVQQIDAIAAASPRMESLIFGVADYAASIAARFDRDQWTEFAYVKQRIIAGAKAAGLDAIDAVTFQHRDLELCREDARRARSVGFDGKWVIHPAQIPVVHEAFTPTAEEAARAARIVEAHRRADLEEGRGAIVVDGEMVDLASVRVQERVLERACRAGLLAIKAEP
ncbi:MAG: CoA ester lyase [Planctomycetes bacterium]|nr:CoA ester lyase [Planctomycetota bacterium]